MKTTFKALLASLVLATVAQAALAYDPPMPVMPICPMPVLPKMPLTPTIPVLPAPPVIVVPQAVEPARPAVMPARPSVQPMALQSAMIPLPPKEPKPIIVNPPAPHPTPICVRV